MRVRTLLLAMVAVTAMVFLVNRETPIGAGGAQSNPSQKASGTRVIEWSVLRGLNAASGAASAEVKALEGSRVKVPGYIVPLDDDANQLTEFLLVPYAGACVHTPPPPPNQMIYVKMTRGERANFALMADVWVEGMLFVGRRSSPYGPTFYSMTANSVTAYQQ